MEELISLFGTLYIQIIGVLIGLDVLFGIIAAIVRKDFAFRKLAMFMKGSVIAYIFGFVVLVMVSKAIPIVGQWLVIAVFILIILALLGSIWRNLKKLGLSLPGSLRGE